MRMFRHLLRHIWKPDDDTTLLNLVNRQMHRHSHTCRKRGKSLCRFNYPQPPMRSTRYQKKPNATQIDLDNLPTELSIDDETNDDDFCDNNTTDKLKTKSGIKKRTNSRIIRSVWFNRKAQPEKHYRELLMLFTPWRNEETDLISRYSSFQEHYLARYDEIGEQMKQYAVCSEDLDEIQQHLNDDNEDQFDSIAPVTQDTELQDEDEGNQDLHPDLNEQYDMSEDIGIPSTAQNNKPLILNEMQDDEYRGLVQSLNKKQKEFFQHALHFIKTRDNPFYAFLSGGGGVGKSHLIKSIYQAAIKYNNSKAGEDFHQVKVLPLAPTGKAAFIIKGNTIHSALAVPASQSLKNYKPLDCSRLNTLRSQLGGVKLILLDEISMVGSNMFKYCSN